MLSSRKNLGFQETIALDASAASQREFDVDGRMRVKCSNISKATVSPYFGREIPESKALGLEPNRIYRLLRDPGELEKAAMTFDSLPLMIVHKAVSAKQPAKELIVGTTGSGTRFESPYLKTSLAVWAEDGIAMIESSQQKQLSIGYRYRADMTPGAFEGMIYDGVMRDIVGNHVALVEKGRAGSDVVVLDSNPFEEIVMRNEKLIAALKPYLAQDADLAAVDGVLTAGVPVEGITADEAMVIATDAVAKARVGLVTADEVKVQVESARKATADLFKARDEVRPLVGEVIAADSAADVYKFGLEQLKVALDGVPPEAFGALFNSAYKASLGVQKAPVIATDSEATVALYERFPTLKTVRHA